MVNPEVSDRNRIYTQEDVQQILNLAIAQHAYEGEFSRDQLLEIAEDLAIPAAIVHQAERAWIQSNDENLKREAFNQHRWAELKRKVGRFAIFNVIFILLNALMGFGFPWSLYILLFWSLSIGLKAWNAIHLNGEAYEKAFQRWYRTYKVRSLVGRWFDRLLSV
ncbi:2TM domain-containing protein [Altericista sp. CCNU0014]|uniref:2TM domain-containing protein n=1 Tax=Altericista sp. CCNU0014 TaxID=3082949 RepID=UPI00384BB0EF